MYEARPPGLLALISVAMSRKPNFTWPSSVISLTQQITGLLPVQKRLHGLEESAYGTSSGPLDKLEWRSGHQPGPAADANTISQNYSTRMSTKPRRKFSGGIAKIEPIRSNWAVKDFLPLSEQQAFRNGAQARFFC